MGAESSGRPRRSAGRGGRRIGHARRTRAAIGPARSARRNCQRVGRRSERRLRRLLDRVGPSLIHLLPTTYNLLPSPNMDLKAHIRHVPDFPKPGILFYDITTLLRDPHGFAATVDQLSEPYRGQPIDAVVGIESRGFILGAAVAARLN